MSKWFKHAICYGPFEQEEQYEVQPSEFVYGDEKSMDRYGGIIQVFGHKLVDAVVKALNDADVDGNLAKDTDDGEDDKDD